MSMSSPSSNCFCSPSSEKRIFSFIKFQDNEKIKKWISEKKINKNVTDPSGFTPLNEALWRRNLKAAHILIENDIHIHVPTPEGNTPLHLAAQTSNYSAIKLLMERGADINSFNEKQQTPLHRAFCWLFQDYNTYKILLDLGASCLLIENCYSSSKWVFERIRSIILHYLKLQKFINAKKVLTFKTKLKFYQTFGLSFKE